MTDSEFNTLIKNFPASDATASALLEDEILHTGYCQSLYVLLARIRQDQHDASASVIIQQAAVHSADRIHLKRVLDQTELQKVNQTIETKSKAPAEINSPETISTEKSDSAIKPFEESPANSGVDLTPHQRPIAEEVENDIIILKEKVKQFSELTTKKKRPLERFLEQDFEGLKREENKSKEDKSEKTVTASRGSKPQDETDLLLNEIKSNRKKVKPDNSRQAEQLAIIDQFIKSNLVTIKPPEKGSRKQDLTETSESYSENVISETLVDILIRQGKKDKAIDVLKKLIWKFPQKKHLFAARIQELSK